jgi:Asp/Glu/hydantoin racemase
MRRKKILVINPNSNETVTAGLRESLSEFGKRADINCCTLAEGPFGIETDEDVARVVPLVVQRVLASLEYDAFVIACYSDPGLWECRELSGRPVFGMQQSAVETAVSFGGKFGVLALSDESIRRHTAYIRKMGFESLLAGELPLNISVDEAANDDGTLVKVIAVGRRLIDEYGASSLILGCAGMAAIKRTAETKLPVPVIEPAQAAVGLAIGLPGLP